MEDLLVKDEAGFTMGENRWKGKTDLATRMDRWCTQFTTMLWKNLLTLWRRPVALLVMLALPSVVLPVFSLAKNEHSSGSDSVFMQPVPLSGLGKCRAYNEDKCVFIAYGPTTAYTDDVMSILAADNGLDMAKDVKGFSTADAAKKYVAENLGTVLYTIRWNDGADYVLNYNDSVSSTAMSRATKTNFEALVLKKELDEAIMKYHNSSAVYDVSLGYFDEVQLKTRNVAVNETTPCDWKAMDYGEVQVLAPLVALIGLSTVGFVAFNIIGEERTKHLVTAYRRLGGADSAYWLAWFLAFELVMLLGSGIATGIAAGTGYDFFESIDMSAYFLLNFLYLTAMLADACFLSSFVSSQSLSIMMIFATFLILVITVCSTFSTPLNKYGWVEDEETGIESCEYVASSYNMIYSPDLAGYDFVQFLVFFMPWFHGGKALTDMLATTRYVDKTFTMADLAREETMSFSKKDFHAASVQDAFLTLLYETLFYVGLAWLLGLIVSNEAGEGRSILSVFFPPQLRDAVFGPSTAPILEGDVRGAEQEMSRRNNSIRLYKLSKTFSGVQALKESTLEMRSGEVFGLLGHNGAGKSTMINVLTGVLAPTHGKVFIQGHDIASDISEVQQFIGVCAQDDLLWDELTAREHLLLFARLKGIRSGPALDRAVDEILERVQLKHRANSLARYFSGGMKRRLSVGMSVVGDVSVVFLDEPTTGLDVMNRRRIWEMIHWIKVGRIVVLTTHNMEEADFLSDQICFLHGGRVRAIGDSLFLKEHYGKGYQVNLVAQPKLIPTLQAGIASILPGVEFADGQNPMTGTLTLTVSRRVVYRLPKLFAWLERSPQAARAIREWGISNTTLEQVFLKLCVQNNEVNFSDGNRDIQDTLCLLCQLRPREPVTLHTAAGIPFVLSDAICKQCSVAPPTVITQQATDAGDESDGFIEFGTADLISLPGLDELLESDGKAILTADAEAIEKGESKQHEKEPQGERTFTSLQIGSTQQHRHSMEQGNAFGVWRSQVAATMVKNGQLQRRQRWSNCCMVFYVLVLFGLLYLFSLLSPESWSDTCPQGYEPGFWYDCSLNDLVEQIFYDDSMLAYQFPSYENSRDPVVWNSLSEPSESAPLQFSVNVLPFPQTFASSNAVNDYITASQENVVEQIKASPYYPSCTDFYAPPTGVTNESSAVEYFQDRFADAAFYCTSCQPGGSFYYRGDVWITYAPGTHYLYGYVDYPAANGSLAWDCPDGYDQVSMMAWYDNGPTITAAAYVELLSNEVVKDAGLEIMSEFTPYEPLTFPGDSDRAATTFLMVMIGMLILNGYWPLTVWRLAYERHAGLITMMRTIGVQTSAYIAGMIGFDMLIYMVNGTVLLGFAVGLELARYDSVPFGLLVAIVFVSAFSMSVTALVLVRVFSKSARFASLLAAIGCIAFAVCTCLMNELAYPDKEDWPIILSIVPFFGQARAMYELFMYEEATENVDLSLTLMFVVSLGLLAISYVSDADITWHQVQLRTATLLRGTPLEGFCTARVIRDDDIEGGVAGPVAGQTDSVEVERQLANTCEVDKFPIVIRELTHTYPATRNSAANFAVRGVSVTMRAGECFGLLGPNGAGKSTTISILSGILESSGGSVFIGGRNIGESKLPIHQLVGICPQFDIIWEELTVEQHLSFQARVRGFTGAGIRAETQRAALSVALDGDAFHTPAGKLSGGMRRRLSIGMATVGNPAIIYLDEPTTGLDPDNRRHVWQIIQSLKTPDRLILLTTHSMEEAEALCSRIGIMAQGALQCLGSSYELKKQFDRGYVLSINLNEALPRNFQPSDQDDGHPFHAVHRFVTTKLANGQAELVSAGNKTLKYNLAKSSTSIARVFQLMENNKANLGVREWGLSMTTLEEVFVSAVNAAESGGDA